MRAILAVVSVRANKRNRKDYNVVLYLDGEAYCPCQTWAGAPREDKHCGHIMQAVLKLAAHMGSARAESCAA